MAARWRRGGGEVAARWRRGGGEVAARWRRGGGEVAAEAFCEFQSGRANPASSLKFCGPVVSDKASQDFPECSRVWGRWL